MNSTGYEITTLESSITYANGTTVSTIVFVVTFEPSILLKENVTSVMEDPTTTGVPYTFGQIVAVKPSGEEKCHILRILFQFEILIYNTNMATYII